MGNDKPINIFHFSDGAGHYQCVCKLEFSANSDGSVIANDLSDDDSLSLTSSACKSPDRDTFDFSMYTLINNDNQYDVDMPDNESEIGNFGHLFL